MKVEHWDAERDGSLTEEALRGKLEKLGYRVTRYTYPPGTYFPFHTHSVDKLDAVLSGQFRIGIRGESALLQAGDFVSVPANIEHEAEVVGSEPIISLDAVKITL
jgi:quercetin dioxygenase-like cupin family protein